MRKFAKISVVLAAMVLALAFVGCKSDDDDDDPSVVTTWYCTEVDEDDESVTETIYFYDDNSFKVTESDDGINIDLGNGTYTGDTTKNGKVKITFKKIIKAAIDISSESTELIDAPSEFVFELEINGNTMISLDAGSYIDGAWLKK